MVTIYGKLTFYLSENGKSFDKMTGYKKKPDNQVE